MQLLPAIDLKDGACVRLLRGDFATVHRVAEDAVETARAFLDAGATLIHMVDLDGALRGAGANRAVVERVIRETGAKVELGGGIRSMQDVEDVFGLGVERVILGSVAVEDPALVRSACARFGERIAVGIDAKDGRVKTRGWIVDGGLDALAFAKQMEDAGVRTIIFTDIDSDGTLAGPAFDRLFALRQAVGCELVASGGVTTMEDLARLDAGGIEGAILGKAIYSGALDLRAAIRRFGGR